MARDQVFISYSHKDKDWLVRLQVHLKPLERKAKIKVWADTMIDPGKKWKEEIQRALTTIKVAVLLVSPHFLASEFIHDNELPSLLAAAEEEGLTILWVLVSDCSYQLTAIAGYQSAYSLDKPLNQLRPAQRDSALVKIVANIGRVLSSPLSPKAVNPEITPVGQSNVKKIEETLLATTVTPVDSTEKTARATADRPAGAVIVPPPGILPAIQNISGWPTQKVRELQQQAALALGLNVEFYDTLKDDSLGAEMVVIPAGEFLMGSLENESGRNTSNEEPQHKVVIAKPFAIGRYTITFEEYDRFCEATRRENPGDEGWGRGRRPVINVTWHDAVAYCIWLSQETGATYRLPTEAEWEYAARAGTTTAFWWGDDIDTTCANYNGNYIYRNGPKGESRRQTVPVDAFQPNPFGLYQVHGNVWEWVQDTWHENYDGAPVDGSAWVEEKNRPCVVRGGSWGDGPRRLRGAARNGLYPHSRSLYRGFRLARTFP